MFNALFFTVTVTIRDENLFTYLLEIIFIDLILLRNASIFLKMRYNGFSRFFGILVCSLSLANSAVYSQRNVDISIHFAGEQLSCRLFLGAAYDSSKPAPLIISMHGFGGNGIDQQNYDDLSLIADTAGFLLAYPDSHNNAWNAGADYYAQYTTFDDVGYISALIDSIHAKYNVDLTRVYACGMSNGGDMAYRLACELSNRIAAIGSVTGTMITDIYSSCAPENRVPVIHFHGTKDDISNINGGNGWVSLKSTFNLWKNINDCQSQTETVLPNLDTKDKSRAALVSSLCTNSTLNYYILRNAGHTWPGTPYNRISQILYGPTNNDIDASLAIWLFCKQFTRSQTAFISRDQNNPPGKNKAIQVIEAVQ